MRFSKPSGKPAEENLIPLINLVFLLLIFFLVTSILRPFDLQAVKLAETSHADNISKKSYILRIQTDGQIIAGQTPIPLEQLEAYIAVNFAELEKPLSLLVDKQLEGVKLIEILTILNRTSLKKIQLVTVRKKGSL